MSREPFTRHQLDYIRGTCGLANRVYGRALKHLDRIGQGGHELREVIRNAENAEHRLAIVLFYYEQNIEKRDRDERRPRETLTHD